MVCRCPERKIYTLLQRQYHTKGLLSLVMRREVMSSGFYFFVYIRGIKQAVLSLVLDT